MKILGIDPGTVVTGYAYIEVIAKIIRPIDLGLIRPPKSDRLSARYHVIFQSLLTLIERFRPTHIAIETPFVHKNAQSALKLGCAMACVLLAAQEYSIESYGYPPAEVKKGITGLGSSTKRQIQLYLSRLLNVDCSQLSKLDATDALAVAVYHTQRTHTKHSNLM